MRFPRPPAGPASPSETGPSFEHIGLAGDRVFRVIEGRHDRIVSHLRLAAFVLAQLDSGELPSQRLLTAARDAISELQASVQ